MIRRLAQSFTEQWSWTVLTAVGLGVLGFVWGYLREDYVAEVRLGVTAPSVTARSPEATAFSQRPAYFFGRTVRHLQSEPFLQKIADSSGLPVTLESLRHKTDLLADPSAGTLTIRVHGNYPELTARLVNAYADHALTEVRELWEGEVEAALSSLNQRLATVENEIAALDQRADTIQPAGLVLDPEKEVAVLTEKAAALDAKVADFQEQLRVNRARMAVLSQELARQNPAIAAARGALAQALTQFTEAHPRVKALRQALAQMEAESSDTNRAIGFGSISLSSGLATNLYAQLVDLRAESAALEQDIASLGKARDDVYESVEGLRRNRTEITRINSHYRALSESRDTLLVQQADVLLKRNQSSASVGLLEPAATGRIVDRQKLHRASRWGVAAGLAGAVVSVLGILAAGGAERRIRNQHDLWDATELPLLGCLGDVHKMTEQARERWACQTLSILKANLCDGKRRALICGITSASPGEGKSTWIRLLARAASKQGYQVAVVSDHPQAQEGGSALVVSTGDGSGEVRSSDQTAQMLAVAMRSGTQAPVRIPLANWVWDWQHRDQFQQALSNLVMNENLVILVEVPAYSTAEGVMLAEKVPNLIWLSAQGMANCTQTRSDLQALRQSGGVPAGAVLNHAPSNSRSRKSAWAAALMLAVALVSTSVGRAASPDDPAVEPPTSPPATPPTLSISSPEQLADWQRRLTLGPGDMLDVSLYGQADSARPGLVIGPDGRINYLQARDFMASGLTVDELRAELEKVLAKFYLAPQVVINPIAYRSKKYYMLGSVNGKGVYLLDRPTTMIEAIAKAGGFVTSMQQQNVAMMVDLGRSFLVRKTGADYARVPVDFEALFLRADLSQNVPLAPDDYLFFPPLISQEVYVLGEVRGPGVVPFTRDLTTLGAIVARGGFTERAWKSKVLIVRGSLIKPEPIVVNVGDILKARGTDIKLANRDIVYVHMKPWAKGEELLDRAAMSFANAVMYGYVTRQVYGR